MRHKPLSVVVITGCLGIAGCQVVSGLSDLEVVNDLADGGLLDSGDAAGGGSAGANGSSGGAGGMAGMAGSDAGSATGGAGGATGGSGGSTGGMAGMGGSGGEPPDCTDPADCAGTDDECQRRTCVDGECGVEFAEADTPISAQTEGDCLLMVCDGSGDIVEIEDDTDIEDDERECTEDTCSNGTVIHNPVAANTPCGEGNDTRCNSGGECVGCIDDGDCPPDTECTDWSCDAGNSQCVETNLPGGRACGDAAACGAGTATLPDSCNGMGVCQDGGTQNCAPYVCAATACRTTCTGPTHCVAGRYCANNGACLPKKGLGTACAAAAECSSGHCVDGVCCEDACSGLCRTCNGADAGGLPSGYCFPMASGRDPQNECAAGRVCNGASGCTGVTVCDCGRNSYSQYENCCTSCTTAECPSQINACNAAHDVPCTAIGNVDAYRSGQGVDDESGMCPSTMRCGVLPCVCQQ